MKAHGTDCCQHEAKQRWARGATGGAIFAVLAVLMPKCPMCIAAWLGVLGLSSLATHVDPRALWLTAALAVAAVGTFVHRILVGRRRDHAAHDGNT